MLFISNLILKVNYRFVILASQINIVDHIYSDVISGIRKHVDRNNQIMWTIYC